MKKNKRTLSFITGNFHKFTEIKQILEQKEIDYQLLQQNLSPSEIQADSLQEVAKIKLNSVKDRVEGSFFIEDAGFFVDSPLNGFPGVYSSYVFKTIGCEGIVKLIDDFERSRAHFSSIIALYFEPKNEDIYFEGRVEGRVSEKPQGSGGFGFDPIFIPEGFPDKTFAEISLEHKNQISHRGKALDKLIQYLNKNQ
ncbi:MAG: dITP/XTP pyrophosphatase [Promethearchaeota archaeon]|nr:MAG: dITP/XTP pyrophosphatase [Candidatus Lokiarchaeota archaeon]